MTIDARTATPEPPLHAATLLSRTRLAQRECAARLGISERTLRYHLTGRPMSYALRCLFESLAFEMELAHRLVDDFRARFGTDFSKSMGGTVNTSRFTEGFDKPGPELYMSRGVPVKKFVTVADLVNPSSLRPFQTTPTDGRTEYLPEVGPPRRFLRDALDAIGPCRLKIRDLTCAEAANPWARTVAAYNAALYGMDFAKVEARATAYTLECEEAWLKAMGAGEAAPNDYRSARWSKEWPCTPTQWKAAT